MWTQHVQPKPKPRNFLPPPHLQPSTDNRSVPFYNITQLYDTMKIGIYKEEDSTNLNHSLENRFQSRILQEKTWSLPKTLHFIWLGNLIKDKYVNNVNLFAEHNSDYKVRKMYVHTEITKTKLFCLDPL